MKFLPTLALIIALFASFVEKSSAKTGEVVVVPLTGAISDASTAFLRRTLKEAENAKASAYVIEMNTPGGELEAAVEILQLLLKARIPTYTWVNTNAGSAGALIALGTDHIYMAPVSAIGAAAPVNSDGADIAATMKDKVVSYFSGYFRSAAEAKGRNPALAEAFIDKDKEFKIGDKIISEKGKLLTLSAQEAQQKFDGKPLLADGIADSIDQLKSEAKLTGPTVNLEPSGFERVAQWITILAPLFLVAGIAAAYLEFKTPGFGVAGFLSLVCFAIFFLGHYIAGLSGMEVIVVFGLGLALVLLELLFFPGVTVVAGLGVALMLGATFFAMVDYFPGDPVIPSPDELLRPAINLSIALVLSIFVISMLVRFVPTMPFFQRLVLATNSPPTPGMPPEVFPVAVGAIGVAHSVLRPAGKAIFGPTLVDVVTEGDFIEPGTAVRILAVNGARVVVTAA